MFSAAFYLSSIIFAFGVVAQIFRYKKEGQLFNIIGINSSGVNFKGFLVNTLFQERLYKAGKIRWALHFCLFLGFLYLFIVHGLYSVTADIFFDDYQPTLNPFQWLRNLAGFLVLSGSVGFLIRRFLKIKGNIDYKIKLKGLTTVVLILCIILTGFLLEAAKIISEPIFNEMVDEYSLIDDEEELEDLKGYWQLNYSVVFEKDIRLSPERMQNGMILNEDNCLYCHSLIKSAVVSNMVAKSISGAGQWLNGHRFDKKFYWLHYILCLVLLSFLPFSRLYHSVLIPFSSGRNALSAEKIEKHGAWIHPATLDACTNCGYCSQVCSVYPNFQIHQNSAVLPHVKIESARNLIDRPEQISIRQLNQGHSECTMCHNCSDICPSGIDLQSLWTILGQKLTGMGVYEKSDYINQTSLAEWNSDEKFTLASDNNPNESESFITSNLADQILSFEHCIQCTVCTSVCPVVDYDAENNDISPHQIMNLLRLGRKHLASGTRMVWSCLTCYSCQENCPQGISVTDIILELRNAGGEKVIKIQNNKHRSKAGR